MEKKCNNIIFIHCSGTKMTDKGSTPLLRYLLTSLTGKYLSSTPTCHSRNRPLPKMETGNWRIGN